MTEATRYQREGHSRRRNESGAGTNKCGAMSTVDATLFQAGHEPPSRKSDCGDGSHKQNVHCLPVIITVAKSPFHSKPYGTQFRSVRHTPHAIQTYWLMSRVSPVGRQSRSTRHMKTGAGSGRPMSTPTQRGATKKMVDAKKTKLEGFVALVLPLERLVEPDEVPRPSCRHLSHGPDHDAAPRQSPLETVILVSVFDPNSRH